MERKFKIGDKVRVVAIKHAEETKSRKYLGKEFVINSYCKDNAYGLYGSVSIWYENELELVKETLFDRIRSSIIEAAKNSPIIVEQTEDGGIKISPVEDKPQPRKSGTEVIPGMPRSPVPPSGWPVCSSCVRSC